VAGHHPDGAVPEGLRRSDLWRRGACCVALLAALALTPFAGSARAQGDPCATPANEIVLENCRTGDPPSEWEVDGAGDPSIQGFATDISVDQGQTVLFKVAASVSNYRLDIYRLGWYGGEGARQVATVEPSAPPPQAQPVCQEEASTGLIDCGNWAPSASWSVPANAVSGIYFARLVREDGTAGASHVPFVVRDDDGRSELLFQTSDTTWQAYNQYGGNSLYTGSPAGRAYKVSYNRPFTTRATSDEDWVFNAEYPMVRWLERNGYDVSYFTGVDSDRLGAEIREHKTFLSVGHDEYWSGPQRANVETARDAGVHLAFFSGNEAFWKTRWEDAHRTLVSYKETHANAKIDPAPGLWTGTWRDSRPFNPEGARPENGLTGTIFTVNSGTRALQVPAAEGRLRLWRNTSVAGLPPGGTATLAAGTVGYEWDEDLDNGARPPGLVRLSATPAFGVEKLLDFGSTYGVGNATHRLTLYRDANGGALDALVFGAGTVQWSWGLDGEHGGGGSTPSAPMQQATVNLLADMLVQPATLQAGLTPAAASTDTTPPASTPIAPTRIVTSGNPVTATGTAADSGGGRVGGVEVSVDGGTTWHPATGRESWSYTWTPAVSGQVTVRSRAADDSGNVEGADAGGQPPPGGTPGGTSPVGGTTLPGATPADRTPPRVQVRPRTVRASLRGLVALRVTCPQGEQVCRVDLRLRRAGSTLARKKFALAGGKARRVSLRLSRGARLGLERSGSLRVMALAAAHDAVGNLATTRTRIRVLAPRSG
jgi:N,N-dimethylformamidase beta subunit-like, C-terminal